jgi:uncharacterized protein
VAPPARGTAGWPARLPRDHRTALADPEPQRFDDAPGAWFAAQDRVTVTLDDGEELSVDGVPAHGTYRFAPIPERGQVSATSGDAVIEVARRGGHLIVRPRHPGHPIRTGYAGTPAYAPDPRWAIEGRYLPYDAPRDVTVGAVVEGLRHVYEAPGEIEFAVDGKTLRLTAGNHLPVAVEAGEKLPREQHPAAGRVP